MVGDSNPVKVSGVDVPNNELTVIDTNNILTSGSQLESVVPKSGEGIVRTAANTGETSVELNNSNGMWIDLDNREGRRFAIIEQP